MKLKDIKQLKDIQKQIEQIEFKEMIRITRHLQDSFRELLEGLNSRISFRDDWFRLFINSANISPKKSDLDKGAERIIHHIYAFLYRYPLSVPIGSDLMYETYDAVVHIDVKTINLKNLSDYKNINLEKTQTSYSCNWFNAALPPIYTKTDSHGNIIRKFCLTYAIYILHEIGSESINSILIINIPNGLLKDLYSSNIILSGKSGRNNPHNARFSYRKFIYYKTIPDEYRVVFLYKEPSKTQKELLGFDNPVLPVLIDPLRRQNGINHE